MPLQLGLSKVMCDLFCIDDAVRSGTTAVLSSLQDDVFFFSGGSGSSRCIFVRPSYPSWKGQKGRETSE